MRIDVPSTDRRDIRTRPPVLKTPAVRRCLPLLSVLAAAPASADRTTTSVTATGDVSATDNVFATEREIRESDVSFTFRPGVLFGYDGPRTSHEVFLEGEVLEFARHSDEPSVSVRGGARTRIQTTRFTSFAAGLEGSNGVLTALSARSSPDVTGPQLVPLGRIDTINGAGNAALSWDTGRDTQVTPSVFARYSRADDNGLDADGNSDPTINTSVEYGANVAISRSWRDNSVDLELGVNVLRLDRLAPLTAMQGSRLDHQLNPRLRAAWRHDWTRRWSSNLDVGGVYVHPYGVDPNNPDVAQADGLFPVFGGAVAYTEVWGRASFQARRDVAPNLLIAQNTINDSAGLSLALPLPWLDDSRRRQPKLVGLASAGVARTQLIDSESGDAIGSAFLVGSIDAGVGYSPRPGFTYGLRYSFQFQKGTDAGEMIVPGFFRNTLSFTFQIRYPNAANGEQARRRQRGGVRADGSDLVPIGVESGGDLPAGGGDGGGGDGGGGGGGDDD